MSIFEAVILGIIEGVTEFLPISSTGHLIIGSSLMNIADEPFTKMFNISIQFGAILSVMVLYWRRFAQSIDFYLKLFVAFIPAAICGKLLSHLIDQWLENVVIVACSLLAGGIVLLFIDRIFLPLPPPAGDIGKSPIGESLDDQLIQPKPINSSTHQPINYIKAFKIGCFQVLALMPGVSRSAATIIGGLSQKLTRRGAAEFSFFLAVPTMFAATCYKMYEYYKDGGSFSSDNIKLLVLGNIIAFLVAMLAIKGFITFLTKHGFKMFGYYRIIVGVLILVLLACGVQIKIV